MEKNNTIHVTKSKEDKAAGKAAKKAEKEMRKAKSQGKVGTSESKLNECLDEDVVNKECLEERNKIKGRCEGDEQVNNMIKKNTKIKFANDKDATKIEGVVKINKSTSVTKKADVTVVRKPMWFTHLFEACSVPENISNLQECILHKSFITLGIKINDDEYLGSTYRCELLLEATKELVNDYEINDDEDLPRTFIQVFDKHVEFINRCRPLTVTMQTAIKYIKSNLMKMTVSDNTKCKILILEMIDRFISERIEAAHKAIESSVSKYIKSGSNIIVYSFSQVVLKCILFAWHQESREYKNKFQVFVVDSFPFTEGGKMIQELKFHGIPFCKTELSAVPTIMKQIDIILLGAHSILSNNTVMSRSGSASIANVAKLNRVPVVICCETYKFCAHGQFDVMEENELGNPNKFIEEGIKEVHIKDTDFQLVKDWKQNKFVTPVDLLYDIIPHRMITMICTELGSISPTTNLKQPIDV